MSFSSNRSTGILAVLLLSILASHAWAHKGMHHPAPKLEPSTGVPAGATEQEINTDFQRSVKPIFDSKCMACHGRAPSLPWYSSLPVAKGLIQHDVEEAKEHLDMSAGFPFGGHGSDLEDLEAIRDSVASGEMPPFRYRLLHWDSVLSSAEKDAVLTWVARAEARLRPKAGAR